MSREAGAGRPRGVPGYGRKVGTEIPPGECPDAILHGSGADSAGRAGAGVAESVDAAASKAAVREGLGVRVPPPVPTRLPRQARATRPVAPERGHHHPMEARQRSSCACVRPTQHRPVRKTRRGEGRTLPVRPARRRRSRAPFAQGSDFPSERGQSVQATLSMSRARPSQAAARRTSSSSSGVGEARSSARLAVKYSGRKPALSSAFM